MASEHKRSEWRWSVTDLMVVLVLYALSSGPAWWLSARNDPNHNGHVARVLTLVYHPLEPVISGYLRLFVDFHEKEIDEVLTDVNSLDLAWEKMLDEDSTGLYVDSGERSAFKTRCERKALALGYKLYWNRVDSRYRATAVRSDTKQ